MQERTRLGRCLMGTFIPLLLAANAFADEGAVCVEQTPGQGETGTLEIHGVAARLFVASFWENGTLHLLPDSRSPLLEPQWTGLYRNIYAPSAVEVSDGWRLFFGAWDGVHTGNDRISSVLTHNFLDFSDRHTVIENGPFIHVCNVNAIPLADSGFTMACTAYPVGDGLNKPVIFDSTDGHSWNGRTEPCTAGTDDLIAIEGYDGFPTADINGMNVLLREGDSLHLYFNNFKDFGPVFRATSKDGRKFQFEGSVLECGHMVNDVKKFQFGEEAWYLMGLHRNTDRLWYSLSRDGMEFAPEHELLLNLGNEDKHIVALGWVVRGKRLLGVLYGAGAVPQLNRNRIFARWLQLKTVFITEDGRRYEPSESIGPDRQRIEVPGEKKLKGHLEIFAEDGVTRIGDPIPFTCKPGSIHRIDLSHPESDFESLLDPDLSVWEKPGRGSPPGWSVEEDILTFSGKGSHLKSKDEDYGDFIFRMDYRLPPGGNSGIYIRNPKKGGRLKKGMEIQLLDELHEKYQSKGLKPWQHTGSIYGFVPPSEQVTNPGGEWNSIEVFCMGPRIRVTVNGKTTVDASMDDYHGLRNRARRGSIALQNHGSSLEFRNVRIRRLD